MNYKKLFIIKKVSYIYIYNINTIIFHDTSDVNLSTQDQLFLAIIKKRKIVKK